MTSADDTRKRWQELANRERKGRPVDELTWHTPEGIAVAPLYTAEDLAALEHVQSLPGFPPFVRGHRATMYAGRPWTIRQYAGFSTAEASNAFYRKNLAAGQSGLSVAFDLATHRGYDSDHPRVVGDVGKAGVAIDTVEDMKILFDDIPLDRMSVSMTMNGAALPIMAMYIVAAEEQGVAPEQLAGTIQNDILKEFMVRNTYIYPPRAVDANRRGYHRLHRAATCRDSTRSRSPATTCRKPARPACRNWHFTHCGRHRIRPRSPGQRAGCRPVCATAQSFFFAIGMNFFMEAAKLRAARLLWSQLMQKLFQPTDQRSLMLRTHCQTSGVSLTSQDPYNNVVFVPAFEAHGGSAGRHSIAAHQLALTRRLALPTEFSARIARNTQLMLQEETGVTNVVDPACRVLLSRKPDRIHWLRKHAN